MVREGKPPVSYMKTQVLQLPPVKDTLTRMLYGEAQAERHSTRHTVTLAPKPYSHGLVLINTSERQEFLI